MLSNSKKELRHQRIVKSLRENLKKRKVFQDKIKKECKKIKR